MSDALRPVLRSAASATLAALLGCYGWRTEPVAPADYIRSQSPAQVRLTLRDSVMASGPTAVSRYPGSGAEVPAAWAPHRVVLLTPQVDGDTIRGTMGRSDAMAIATDEVTAVASRHLSAGKTIAAVLVPVAVLFGVACLMACGMGSIGFN